MNRGYVKLWRKTLDGGILKNGDLCRFWLYCLLKASHKTTKTIVGYQEVTLLPGQFIFGRKKAAKELSMSVQIVRTCVKNLDKSKNLTIKPTNKFSIISILNWGIYQQTEYETNHQANQQLTINQPSTNHKQECIKNVKKEKNTPLPPKGEPDFVSPVIWKDFEEHRRKLKAPLTDQARRLIFKKLKDWKSANGWNPDNLLNQSIERGWKGVFPPEILKVNAAPPAGKKCHKEWVPPP